MGVFKRKDKTGKPTGPWYIQFPHERNLETGKIKYRTERVSWQKKKAQELLKKKQEEFLERDKLGITHKIDMTFSELLEWGLAQEVMKVKASALSDQGRADQLKEFFGKYEAIQVTPLMADNFRVALKNTVSERTGRPYSGTTVNKTISLARRIYYLAMDQGIVKSNPFARRGAFKEPPKGRYIPDEDFRALLEYLPDFFKPVAQVAYLTGMRRGEIFNLRWSQVDVNEGTLDLSAEDTKTSEPRVIYLGSLPELRRIFVEAKLRKRKGQKLVFTKPDGTPLQKQYSVRFFKQACKKAKVGPYRFHDLRHTFATTALKAGISRTVIMKLTGHKTLAMFLRYAHLDREQAESAMESLGEFLSARRRGANG